MNKEELRILNDTKTASRKLALSVAEQRSIALQNMAQSLENNMEQILAANGEDIRLAKEAQLAQKRINILTIHEKDIHAMADFFRQVSAYTDPVGTLLETVEKKNGLRREKRLQPVGVVGVVYEARPSVVTDTAALCVRSGNALLLRCSSHCIHTDETIVALLKGAVEEAGLPKDMINLISKPGHELTLELAGADRLIDLLIVRSGYEALRQIKAAATVPVIGAGPGNCHIFIDQSAYYGMAEAIVINSKVPRPLACNAAETLLIQRDWAKQNLPSLLMKLSAEGITIHGCSETCALWQEAVPAEEKDWMEEYFAADLAVKIVENVEEAIEHINHYRTPHTEAIVTENSENAALFLSQVEANVVCHNAATRLTDGIEFDLGGEMGISTQKYPVGGPIGIRHLMQEKYYLFGKGTLR